MKISKNIKKFKYKAFTIIELIIVISVIAILCFVLIPLFSNTINNTKEVKIKENAKNIYEMYIIDNINNNLCDDIIIKNKNDECVVFVNNKLYDNIYSLEEAKQLMINTYNKYIIFEQYNVNIILVKPNNNLVSLEKVTNINQLQENLNFVLGFESNGNIYMLSYEYNVNYPNYINSIELENSDIMVLDDKCVFVCTLVKNGIWWGFKDLNNEFLDPSEENSQIIGNLKFREYNDVSCVTNYHLWEIIIDNDEIKIISFQNKEYSLQYNTNGYFGCYMGDNYNVNLYIVKEIK